MSAIWDETYRLLDQAQKRGRVLHLHGQLANLYAWMLLHSQPDGRVSTREVP